MIDHLYVEAGSTLGRPFRFHHRTGVRQDDRRFMRLVPPGVKVGPAIYMGLEPHIGVFLVQLLGVVAEQPVSSVKSGEGGVIAPGRLS
jgi:hypothetical protein